MEPQIALFNAGKGAAHMFETDEIYQMWEELLQLSDPAARDAQLRKIGNNKFEQFECIPLFNVFIRQTGVYIPELAEKWEMSPDGKRWTITLRKGVKFHKIGGFTAKDMRHSVFLITQLESEQTDAGLWRSLMGIGKADTVENVAKKVEQGVQIVDDYQVVIHAKFPAPELIDTLFLSKLTWPWRARCVGMLGARSCMDRRWWAPALRVRRVHGGLVRPLQAGGESLAQDT